MKYNKTDLNKLINEEQLSYREIGRRYNVSDEWIKQVARQLGIILPQRKKFPDGFTPANKGRSIHKCLNCDQDILYFGKKFCSQKCSDEYRSKKNYKKFLETDGLQTGNPFYNPKNFKKYFLEEQNNKCAICGCEPIWNNKDLVFVLDHIDGHCCNNKRKNIRLICPNCDSQLDTYKSKNKHSDRTERYKKQKKS